MQINKICLGNVVDQHASLSRLQPGFESRPRRIYKRFDSFRHPIYKGGKAQGILTNMPSYFNTGAEQVKAADHRVEKLPEPNRQYAKDFENYLQVLNRKPRTIGRRMLEFAWLLEHSGIQKGT